MLSGPCQRQGRTGGDHLPPSCGSLGALQLGASTCSHCFCSASHHRGYTSASIHLTPASLSLFLSFQLFKFFSPSSVSTWSVAVVESWMQLCGYSCPAPCTVVLQSVSFGQQGWRELLISALVSVLWEPWNGRGAALGQAMLSSSSAQSFCSSLQTSSPSWAQFALGVGREQLFVGMCCKHCWLPKLVPCLLLFLKITGCWARLAARGHLVLSEQRDCWDAVQAMPWPGKD